MTRPFINRINETKYLKQALRYGDNENPVLVFTGIGGMGKTALRIAFEEQALVPKKIPYAVLDYETDPNLRPIEGTLRAIRRQLGRQGIKTPVFDFLFGRYFELSTGIKLSAKHYPIELEGVMTILSGIPGIDHIAKITHGLSQLGLAVKERLQHKEWLYRLRELEPREILSLLPEVLAEDLEEAMTLQKTPVLKDSGARITLLFDAYERLSETAIDDFLHRKLLLLTPHLLRIIFTRDTLPWEHKYPADWSGKIVHYPALDVLGRDDAIMLLQKKHVKDQELQAYLYELTNGFPFYLELCVDICREVEEMTGKPAKIADFEGIAQAKDVTRELINLLSRQLADNEKDLIGLASYPRYITEEILEVISSVPESVSRAFKKLINLSMFSDHPSITKAYVLRKEVRNYLFTEQRSVRLFKDRHRKLKEYHSEKHQTTNAFQHFSEALYHGFYEDATKAMEVFEANFWQLLEKHNFNEADGLLEAVSIDLLNEAQKRRIDYARARLLLNMGHSHQSLSEARAIFEALIASEKSEDLLEQYCSAFGDYLLYISEIKEALTILQKALAIGLKLHGQEHPDIARYYLNIGVACRNLGKYEEALININKALQILVKVHGEEHPDVAWSYIHIGRVYIYIGRGEEALININKALQILIKVYGEEHHDVAMAYDFLMMAYEELGRYEEALIIINKAFPIFIKIYGDEHPWVPYHFIGRIYRHLGRYEEALIYSNKALQIFIRALGEISSDVAMIYDEIGVIYQNQGRYEEALINLKKALQILIKVHGEEHPRIADVLSDTAYTLHAMNRKEEALEKMRHSIAIYKNFKLWKKAVKNLEVLAQWYEESGKASNALEARTEAQNIKKDHGL
jgi:tetratricopeptide (TPR) repeat protein